MIRTGFLDCETGFQVKQVLVSEAWRTRTRTRTYTRAVRSRDNGV